MADGDPIIIGQDNIASNPGAETILRRDANSTRTDPVFTVRNDTGVGVRGTSTVAEGVVGKASHDDVAGVLGTTTRADGIGVRGMNRAGGLAVSGISAGGGGGVDGTSDSGFGVRGITTSGIGVRGETASPSPSKAASFVGDVDVIPVPGVATPTGILTVTSGRKNFKIDHPVDPENRYLLHTCVESSEMKNVYDGVAQLDGDGSTWVELPQWFEALNGDFRYQLTAVGGPAPGLHVAEEVSENRFKIAGGEEGMKVCWQVTGSRKDPWAAANPFEVEQEKREEERGRYLEPSLYDAPEEQRVMIGPIAEAVEEEHRLLIETN